MLIGLDPHQDHMVPTGKVGGERTERKSLVFMMVILTLSGLSASSLYNASQLWISYCKVIDMLYAAPSAGSLNMDSWRPALEAYNRYFLVYVFGGFLFLAVAGVLLVFRTKLICIDLSKLLMQLRLGREHFASGIVVSVLLALSGFLFYRAYDLWSEFRRIIVVPEILAIIPKVTMIETYYEYFPLYLLYGLVLLTCAIIVLFQTTFICVEESKPLPQLQIRRKAPALRTVVLGLLIVSVLFFYGAYNLWSSYQSSSETWYPLVLPSIDYRHIEKIKIETYEKLFLPYLIGGVGTMILASSTIVPSIRKQKPFNVSKNSQISMAK